MNTAPDISDSTAEERRRFIREKYPCIADCDMCGQCRTFHGMDAENAYGEYIRGERSFGDVSAKYRRS